jgi:hypothetical protein
MGDMRLIITRQKLEVRSKKQKLEKVLKKVMGYRNHICCLKLRKPGSCSQMQVSVMIQLSGIMIVRASE